MFRKRPDDQSIEFTYLGSPSNMPSGNEIKSGDSVILKLNQYEIEIENVATKSESNYTGVVNSITDINSDLEVQEIQKQNIKIGAIVEFSESVIFCCTRKSN